MTTQRYRLLGTTGCRISRLALGTMTFGEAWGWGASPAACRDLLDRYLATGGNVVDTSSNYTDGESESIVGDLLGARRDRVVLSTKYTLTDDPGDPNAGGNHRKNMVRSVEASLRRLRTDRVDLLWMHMWDGMTPVDEVARALDDLVRAGKVLHVGYSDSPAWLVARGVALAEWRGWTRPAAVQLPYSVASRDAERELIPMAAAHGLTVFTWGALEGGVLTGKYAGGEGARRYAAASARGLACAQALAEIAADAGCTPAQAAIAWQLMRPSPGAIVPIIGARTAGQLDENLGAVDVDLDAAALARLDAVAQPQLGFPLDFLRSDEVTHLIFGTTRTLIDA